MLVYSSLSQDLSIIIFLINKTRIPSKFSILIKLIIIAQFLPFSIGAIYLLIGGVGLNDRYCYIKNLEFKERGGGDNYYIYDNLEL